MARIEVDSRHWPLVRATLPASVSDDDVRAYLEELRALRERRQPYALIIDAIGSGGFTAKQRQMQGEYVRSGIELSRRYLKAFAFVSASPAKRAMLSAVFWLSGIEWPHKVCGSTAEAEEWARRLVEVVDR
jgi:hypothetical protein